MLNIGWDTETHLISENQIIPPIVCGTFDCAEHTQLDSQWRGIEVTAEGNSLTKRHLDMFQASYNQEARIIIHNASFDLTVIMRYCMDVLEGSKSGDRSSINDLYFLIWEVLDKSLDNEWENCQNINDFKWVEKPILISDTLIREKLMRLSSRGHVDGTSYALSSLVYRYLGIDISDKKVSLGEGGKILDADGVDITGTSKAASIWRLRYKELDRVPLNQWPQDAIEYAISDATYARQVWVRQEEKRARKGYFSMNSESLQVYADTALRISTANGFNVDQAQVAKVQGQIGERLSKIEPILVENGIIKSNGSVNTRVVKGIVSEVWEGWLDRSPLLTNKGDIATNKEVMEIISQFDHRLDLYAERQLLSKITNSFLPALKGPRVWTNFDILKETGRTSSTGSSVRKGRAPAYVAVNSQQIPRRPGIRESFLPPHPNKEAPDGYVIASVDYGALELCGVAQSTFNILGWSVHRDRINDGYDLHSFLGSRLAMLYEPQIVNHQTDHTAAYQYMIERLADQIPDNDQSSEAEDRRYIRKRAKHFRNLAKPVGLGYPGGLGEKTMCVFARTVYKVDISLDESAAFKRIWFELYPEMVEYFKWVNQQIDRRNKDEDGYNLYAYATPGFYRFRSGATYCATANGASMQSLSADGAKRGVCWIQRACCGGLNASNPYRILDQCAHLTFIHDENLVAIPRDSMMTERAIAVKQLMIEAMGIHMPDVKISAEPALMGRWIKAAEPILSTIPGDWDRSVDGFARRYGHGIANAAGAMFRSSQGGDYRLVPWDDINKWEREQP